MVSCVLKSSAHRCAETEAAVMYPEAGRAWGRSGLVTLQLAQQSDRQWMLSSALHVGHCEAELWSP